MRNALRLGTGLLAGLGWLLLAGLPSGHALNCTCGQPGWPGPLVFDRDYNRKPAYHELVRALGWTQSSARLGLRDLAEGRILIGSAAVGLNPPGSDGERYRRTLAFEFNMLTPENAMKFAGVHTRGSAGDPGNASSYDFGEADRIVEFAAQKRMRVRGHTLVWHVGMPEWVLKAKRDQLVNIFRQHTRTVVSHFREAKQADGTKAVFVWDVVNEAVHDSGEKLRDYGIWSKFRNDDDKKQFIKEMFAEAHRADPEALLFYNDFDVVTSPAKQAAVLELVEWLADSGTPIHGLGLQMHLKPIHAATLDVPGILRQIIDRLARRNLIVHVTEMDVRFQNCLGTEAQQAQLYRGVLECLWESNAGCKNPSKCNAFTMWGFTDRHTWIPPCPAFSASNLTGTWEIFVPTPSGKWNRVAVLKFNSFGSLVEYKSLGVESTDDASADLRVLPDGSIEGSITLYQKGSGSAVRSNRIDHRGHFFDDGEIRGVWKMPGQEEKFFVWTKKKSGK